MVSCTNPPCLCGVLVRVLAKHPPLLPPSLPLALLASSMCCAVIYFSSIIIIEVRKGGSSRSVSERPSIVEGSSLERHSSLLTERRTQSCDSARSTEATPIHGTGVGTPIHSGVGEYVIMTRDGSSVCGSPPDSTTTPAANPRTRDGHSHSPLAGESTPHNRHSQVSFTSCSEVGDSKVAQATPLKGKAQPLNSAGSSTTLAKDVSRDESLQGTAVCNQVSLYDMYYDAVFVIGKGVM